MNEFQWIQESLPWQELERARQWRCENHYDDHDCDDAGHQEHPQLPPAPPGPTSPHGLVVPAPEAGPGPR